MLFKEVLKNKKLNEKIDKFASVSMIATYFFYLILMLSYFFKVLTTFNIILIFLLSVLIFIFLRSLLLILLSNKTKNKEILFASLSILVAVIIFLFSFLYTQKEIFENIEEVNSFNYAIASKNNQDKNTVYLPFETDYYIEHMAIAQKTFSNKESFDKYYLSLLRANALIKSNRYDTELKKTNNFIKTIYEINQK